MTLTAEAIAAAERLRISEHQLRLACALGIDAGEHAGHLVVFGTLADHRRVELRCSATEPARVVGVSLA